MVRPEVKAEMYNRHAQPAHSSSTGEALPDVGLFIDDDRAIAAVSHPLRSNPSLHVASLHPTVLFVHADGSASLGGTDDADATEFTGFISDTDDRGGFSASDLTAMTMLCLLSDVSGPTTNGVDALAAAATYPATWTAEHVGSVRESMNRHGLGHVALVSEAEALRAWSESTLSTWAGSDSGIAAARGAAAMASAYPVDAVTERIPVAGERRTSTRTPILLAAGFAAVLTLAAGVTALALRGSDATVVPTIDSADVAAPTTTVSSPAPQIPFPTVVPIVVEPEAPAVQVPTVEVTTPPETTPPVVEEPVATRPAADATTTTPDATTPDRPEEEPSTPEVPEEDQSEEVDEGDGSTVPTATPDTGQSIQTPDTPAFG
ncbi:hypothetical protein [Rhodococcoides kyotonense]|uniref:Uncharacterized protein n=1 Tax=Rhodococcoides kyotonense TaxID=398843 RepID=A0A177YGQ2_9NOCA|nr:hypothetical protein [Rhodococcus kyotonensis]OAK54724.1 hypothetical protein A3K89_05150 [Rhodococcus kyotonensis]